MFSHFETCSARAVFSPQMVHTAAVIGCIMASCIHCFINPWRRDALRPYIVKVLFHTLLIFKGLNGPNLGFRKS